jgi:transcription elongation factor Elf1
LDTPLPTAPPSRAIVRYAIIFGLLLGSLFGAVYYRYSLADMPAITSTDGQPTYYWYCERCGHEAVCVPGEETETVPCPNCGLGTNLHAFFTPHTWRYQFLTAGHGWIAKGVLFLPALGALILLMAGRSKAAAMLPPEKPFTFTCKACGHTQVAEQKQRHQVICSQCHYVIVDVSSDAPVPHADVDEDDELMLWWRQVRIKRRRPMD